MPKPGRPDVLYIGIGGHAVALDAATGTELWRTKLRSSSFVTVFQSGSRLFAGAGGQLFCLDCASGDVLWCNKLKALGTGLVAFSSSSGIASVAALQAQQAAMVGAAVGVAAAT